MADYKKMYFELFNSVTDAIGTLQKAQQRAEEAYMQSEETPLKPLQRNNHRHKDDKSR
ncbi:MAG: hypothetical protein ABF904_09135 [Ethanoligenens sp.]